MMIPRQNVEHLRRELLARSTRPQLLNSARMSVVPDADAVFIPRTSKVKPK